MDVRESSLEDEGLVAAFRGGQTQAFERLVEKYFGTIFSVCFAHVREREQAEELAQEVVLRMYLHMDSLKSGRALAAWVGGIARNLSRDWLRRGQTRSRLLPMVPLEQLAGDLHDHSTPTPRHAAAEAEEQRMLEQALKDLPADQREVVLLHYAEGLSKSEIARRLGVFPSSVGRRLDRALESLKLDLEPRLRATASNLKPRPAVVARAMALAIATSQLSAPAKAALAAAAAGAAVGGTSAAVSGSLSGQLISPIVIGGIKMTKGTLLAAVLVVGSAAGFGIWIRESAKPARADAGDIVDDRSNWRETARSTNVRTIKPANSAPEQDGPRARGATEAVAADVSERTAETTATDVVVAAPEATSVTLALTVLDWSTSQPVPEVTVSGATVLADGAAEPLKQLTSETLASSPDPGIAAAGTGVYLVGPVAVGKHVSVHFSATGYSPAIVNLAIPKGTGTLEKTVRMAKVAGLTGRVVEPGTKTPVAGVVLASVTPGATGAIVTGEDGRFTLPNLPSGIIKVQIEPKQKWPKFSREFTTAQGMTKDVGDIELTKIASSIRGRVIAMPGEEPLPGKSVELTTRNRLDATFRDVTDENGFFEFHNLENATYIAWVLDQDTEKSAQQTLLEQGVMCFQQVTLGTEEQRDLVLRVGRVTLRGRVTRDGEPVRGNVHLSQGATGYLKEMAAQTDADGRFELKNVASGWWLGAVHATSIKGTWNDWFRIPEESVFEYEFVLPSGKVTGLVQGPDGKPAADARVFIVKNDTGSFDVIKPPVAMDTKTKADGTFTLPSAKGRFHLRAKKEGLGMAPPVEVEVPESGETAPVIIKLGPAETGSIRSVALDYADGSPLKKATLNLYDEASRLEVKAARDEDGVMVLEELPVGKYRVLVSAPGYSVDERHVEVKAGEASVIESVLYESGVARIIVQDGQGEFLPGVKVNVMPEDRASIEEEREGVTSRGGLVMLRGLSPGGYVVTAETPEGKKREDKINVRAREITDWLMMVK